MSQHFLLSAAARTLSVGKVLRLSDAEAYEQFKAVRWPVTRGAPVCPRCGSVECYTYAARRIFKCKGCGAQFSVTTATIFASRKLSHRDILAAIALFVNGAKGVAALRMSRDLCVQYKTAFVLLHKMREAMGVAVHGRKLTGEVEVDGGYFGGYRKPENHKTMRVDRRRKEWQTGKRKCVVIVRERKGNARPFVFDAESDSLPTILRTVEPGSIVHADEASTWDALHSRYLTKRINHQIAFSDEGACTNQAESFFSRLRRAEIGTHHHISGQYLQGYADEMAWRENHRRIDNGSQYFAAAKAALAHPVSGQWKGYWQRAW